MTRFLAVTAVALSTLLGASMSTALGQGLPVAERFVLSGVLVFDGGSGLAWLQEPAFTGNRVVAVRPGDSIGPYRLTKILEDRVELQGPGGTVLVPVHGGPGGAGSAIASNGPGGSATHGGSATARSARPARSLASLPPSIPLEQIGNPQADAALAKALMDRMELLRSAGQEAVRPDQQQAAQHDSRSPAPGRSSATQEAPAPAPPAATSQTSGNPAGADSIMLAPGDPLRRQTFQSFLGLN